MKKRIILMLVAVISFLLCFPAVHPVYAAIGLTRSDAVSWARAQNGRTGNCDVDGNGLWCTDLVTAYMNYLWLKTNNENVDPWGLYPYTTKMAYAYDDYVSGNNNWTVIARDSSTVPSPGDIFVSEWDTLGNGYGHVGIVLTAYGNTSAEIIEMSGGVRPRISTITWGSEASYNPQYFIRFNYFLPDPDPTPAYVDLGDDFYATILNTKLWKTISLNPENHKVTLETEKAVPYQKWRFLRQSDGAYVIASCYDGNALEMTAGITANGTQLTATVPDWGADYQRWYLCRQGNGYIIQNKHYKQDNWVMDLRGGISGEDGTSIDIYTRNNGDNQIFSVYLGDDIQLAGVPLKAEVSKTDGTVKFTFNKNDARGAKGFNLKIWKNKLWEGDAYIIKNDISSGCSVKLDEGTYYAYLDSYDYFHYEKSNVVELKIEKHIHTPKVVPSVDPMCSKSGKTEGIRCSVCGEVIKAQETIPALGHSWDKGKVTKEATISTTGVKKHTCTRCKATKTEKIPKLTPTIKLSPTKKSIKAKKSFTLTVKLANGDKVTSVKSGKTSVATVKKAGTNKFTVTGKKKGTAVITVKLKSGKKATCTVVVK